MSLEKRLQELTTSVFVDTERFGEEVIFIPECDWSQKMRVRAVVDKDSLPGTNENPGDGRNLNRPAGRWVRESVQLELSSCVNVRKIQPIDNPDAFLIDNEYWSVKRHMGSDGAMQTLLLINNNALKIRNFQKFG